jgi:pimeloyl-ACP methyl ester carboxylesterase
MNTVVSADGTKIAFEQVGDGPGVILVGGAFNDRSTVTGLADVLAPGYTAIAYDRRGRGDSGDSPSYAIEREVEDIAALIDHVGGSAHVFGHSSGAILALEAAERGLPITTLAVYEPPYIVDGTRSRPADDVIDRLRALVREDRRDDAATLFVTEAVGVPVDDMRGTDMWGWFTALAHTLPYDVEICGPGHRLPLDRLASITTPTLAIGGGTSPGWLPAAAQAVADTIPGGRYVTLDGHDHGVLAFPSALRPILVEFFSG